MCFLALELDVRVLLARCRRWTDFVVKSHMKYIRGPDFSSVLVRMEYIALGGGSKRVSLKCQGFIERKGFCFNAKVFNCCFVF